MRRASNTSFSTASASNCGRRVEHQQVAPIFLALQESALGHAMRSSPALYPAVEILHILGFVVLVGSILALDLRLLGLRGSVPSQAMAPLLLPLSRSGFPP